MKSKLLDTLLFIAAGLWLFLMLAKVAGAGTDSTLHQITVDYPPGYVVTYTFREDGRCVGGCNTTLRLRTTGTYPIDKTYRAKTHIRSTGQLDTILKEVENEGP